MDNALRAAENDDYLFLLHYVLSLDKYRTPYRQNVKRAIKQIYCFYKDKFQLDKKEFDLFKTLYPKIFGTKQVFYTLNGKISINAKLTNTYTELADGEPLMMDDGTLKIPMLHQLGLTDCKLNFKETTLFYEPLDQLLGCCFGEVFTTFDHERIILVSEQTKFHSFY